MVIGVSDDGAGMKAAKWTLPSTVATQLEPITGGDYSGAYGLNNAGVVVGEAKSGPGVAPIVAVSWAATATTPTPLSIVGLEGVNSAAYDINNNGAIVGEGEDALGNLVAVIWPNSGVGPIALPHLDPTNLGSSAYFISDGDVIVGESRDAAGNLQAVAWIPSNAGYGTPLQLTAMTGQVSSIALGVDLAGNIVGEAELADGIHGVVWSLTGAVVADLGVNTSAQAISHGSGSDRIVGYVNALNGADQATVWNRLDLTDKQEFDPFSQAYSVNDSFTIVGVMDNKAVAATAAQ
jgi:uncharacterized membrane protein